MQKIIDSYLVTFGKLSILSFTLLLLAFAVLEPGRLLNEPVVWLRTLPCFDPKQLTGGLLHLLLLTLVLTFADTTFNSKHSER